MIINPILPPISDDSIINKLHYEGRGGGVKLVTSTILYVHGKPIAHNVRADKWTHNNYDTTGNALVSTIASALPIADPESKNGTVPNRGRKKTEKINS